MHVPIPGTWTRRRVVVLAVVVASLALAAGGWAYARVSAGTTPTTTTTLVAATTTTLSQTVTTTGTVQPAVEASLDFPVAGTVAAVQASVGQQVAQGATLATLDPTDLQSAVDVAQAQLAAAQQQVTDAASSTSTARSSAAATETAAQSKLTSAQQALAGATLTSPIAGTVASVDLTPGTQVGAGSSSTATGGASGGPGTGRSAAGGSSGGGGSSSGAASSSAQVVVISTSSWVVDAGVTGADLASIKPGLQAQLTPTGATQPVFGTVSTVGIVATSTTGGAATFPVTIALTGTPTGLYAGGTGDVAITVAQVQDAVTVPTAALSSDDGVTTVQRSVDGQVSTQPVTVGLVSGPVTQIVSGLSDGDQVVVTGRTGGTGGGSGGGTGRSGGRAGYGGGSGGGSGGGTGGGA